MERVKAKFMERAKLRDPIIDEDVMDRYIRDEKDTAVGTILLNRKEYNQTAHKESNVYREYMAREGV